LAEAATPPMHGLTALHALDIARFSTRQTLGVSGGAGWLAEQAIVFARQRRLRTIADAKAEERDLVRRYGTDTVVRRSDDFASAVRREVPEGVDALLDTALLGESSFAAIRTAAPPFLSAARTASLTSLASGSRRGGARRA
jgi:NADPH:quinone reductase-like Zn-dependent oxidoreductase